ncbi:unnamed protein product, partial [Meganyctiphanes norvegica]
MSNSIGTKVALGAAILTGGVTLFYILTGRKRQPDPGKACDPLADKSKVSIQKEGSEMNGHACIVKESKNISSEVKREDSDKDSSSYQNGMGILDKSKHIGNDYGGVSEFEEPVIAKIIESVEKTPVELTSQLDDVKEPIEEDLIYTVAVVKNECIIENPSDDLLNNEKTISENDSVDKCEEALSLVNNEIIDEINVISSDSNVDHIPVESITEEVELEKCVEALSLVEEEIVVNSMIENSQDSVVLDINIVSNINKTEAKIAVESDAALDKKMTKLADSDEIISEIADNAKMLAETTQSEEIGEIVNVCVNSSPLSSVPAEVKEEVLNEVMSSSWASVVEEEENLQSMSCNGSEESLGNDTFDSSRKLNQSPTSNSSHSSS